MGFCGVEIEFDLTRPSRTTSPTSAAGISPKDLAYIPVCLLGKSNRRQTLNGGFAGAQPVSGMSNVGRLGLVDVAQSTPPTIAHAFGWSKPPLSSTMATWPVSSLSHLR